MSELSGEGRKERRKTPLTLPEKYAARSSQPLGLGGRAAEMTV